MKKILSDIRGVVHKNNTIVTNFSLLGGLQISNLLIFFLLIPYLIRVLGSEKYGLIVFSQTIAGYFSLLINFGFNTTATRDISIFRDDYVKRNEIISSTFVLKASLFAVISIIYTVLIFAVPFLHRNSIVFLTGILLCMGDAINPIWFFQGTEKLKHYSIISLATKFISGFSVFLFISKPSEYFLVPIVLSAGTIAGAIAGILIIFSDNNNRLAVPTFASLKANLKGNFFLFVSNVSSQIYVNANRFIAGTFLGMQELAIYDVAERIINMVKVPIALLAQVLLPKVSRDRDISYIKKTMLFSTIIYFIIFGILVIFSDTLIRIFIGTANTQASFLITILGVSIIPICAGMFYADLILVPFGFLKDYAKMRISSLIVYLLFLLIFSFTGSLNLEDLGFCVLITEFFVLFYSVNLVSKKNLIISDSKAGD
jgi:PST family polysaccharide transporter